MFNRLAYLAVMDLCLASLTQAIPRHHTSPRRTIAGVSVVDTAIVRVA
jgi:hypothetical protein